MCKGAAGYDGPTGVGTPNGTGGFSANDRDPGGPHRGARPDPVTFAAQVRQFARDGR